MFLFQFSEHFISLFLRFHKIMFESHSFNQHPRKFRSFRSLQVAISILKKQIEENHFGSFLFSFISDSIMHTSAHGITLSGTISNFLYIIMMVTGAISFTYLGNDFDSKMKKFLTSYCELFQYTPMISPDDFLTFGPFYIQIFIFIICTIAYICFYIHRIERYYSSFFHSYFLYFCLALSTPFITYELIAMCSSIFKLIETHNLHCLIIPYIGLYCLPALIISSLRSIISLNLSINSWSNSSISITCSYYFSLIITMLFNSIGYFCWEEKRILFLFYIISIIIQVYFIRLFLIRIFLINKFTKIFGLLYSLIIIYSSILGIYRNAGGPSNKYIFGSFVGCGYLIICTFAIIYIDFKTTKLQAKANKFSLNDALNISENEMVELLSYTIPAKTLNLANKEIIKIIFDRFSSLNIKLLGLRYLLEAKVDHSFIYEKAVELLTRYSTSMLTGIQLISIVEITSDSVFAQDSTLHTLKKKQVTYVMSLCYAAQVELWRSILHSSKSEILHYAYILNNEIKNATNFFKQMNINERSEEQYGQQYVNFITNITGNLEELQHYQDPEPKESSPIMLKVNRSSPNLLSSNKLSPLIQSYQSFDSTHLESFPQLSPLKKQINQVTPQRIALCKEANNFKMPGQVLNERISQAIFIFGLFLAFMIDILVIVHCRHIFGLYSSTKTYITVQDMLFEESHQRLSLIVRQKKGEYNNLTYFIQLIQSLPEVAIYIMNES
ncbi:hypothetical protein TRFO_39173 [Tritrichomonas foetus]|uniref:Transmembrane protein n=1 Tax=Tritrichomonas foetus TaxID=1144522 RepID=A0A1J4JAJ1_9EUKA|nr:hypothetical protein TRFO_39173 [Tritrichomonas foetus]|eukprot:OHS94675.1 hypothetical protein TRFO_39173 [Tritrichomonas foetus]